jgi:hypothetical protein
MQAIHRKARKPVQLVLDDEKTRFAHHLIMGWGLQESIVYRLLNPLGFAAGQLAVFQGGPSRTGGCEEHIQIDT